MPIPINKELYARVKKEADGKFLAKTSAYKSAWIVTEYKKRGGVYVEDGEKKGLTQWFKEKWVDLRRPVGDGYAECGRSQASAKGTYPLCRPSKRVNKSTPATITEIDPSKLSNIKEKKQRIKYKGRVKF
jgi:hypothetical protein